MILSYSEKQFLDLVKLSLNDIPVPESLMDEIDWDEIYAHAKNQAVVGIVFDAIKKLPQTKNSFNNCAKFLKQQQIIF